MAIAEKPISPVRIGVLALQGSFREHIASLRKLAGVDATEVRTKEELAMVDGLIIPGGESTTMALIAERWGLIPELRNFAKQGCPIWGTCAGLIFLADKAVGMKEGGQALLGGLDCSVSRNFFGAQINSFETLLPAPPCLPPGPDGASPDFRALFIRAPAVLEAGPCVDVLAEYVLTEEEAGLAGRDKVAVAVRSGPLLATAFHPELTDDLRWHQLFVDGVRQRLEEQKFGAGALGEPAKIEAGEEGDLQNVMFRPHPNQPRDLPVFAPGQKF